MTESKLKENYDELKAHYAHSQIFNFVNQNILIHTTPMGQLNHPNACTIKSFYSLAPENLLSTLCDWNGELNSEGDSELDILYAYL